MKTLKIQATCRASYKGSIEVPDDMSLEEAVKYAREHLDEIACEDLQYLDGDKLDEELCEFE